MSKNKTRPIEKQEYEEIDTDSKIKYVPITKRLGRAEFNFCPVFNRGKMVKLLIHRMQQEAKEQYELNLEKLGYGVTSFGFSSWTHKGIDEPYVWQNWWCKEHKCVSFCVYVPNNTNTIEFDYYFGCDLTIRFVAKNEVI